MSKGFQEGTAEFTFPNGDVYSGEYCAHVSGVVWRKGHGVYLTHDGQTYKGNWKDDKLNEAEPVKISFQNKDKYVGKLHKYKYQGPGAYSFPNKSFLSCVFANNKPTGKVIFADHLGELWYGDAGFDNVILAKEHVFSSELDEARGKGEPLYKPKIEILQPEEGETETFDMKELEKMIFAKSEKTRSDFDFENSEWYQEFKANEEIQHSIKMKLAGFGSSSLTEQEKLWYKDYLRSVKLLKARYQKKEKKVYPELLRRYFEEQAKYTCPPDLVLYPRGEDQSGENSVAENETHGSPGG